jgi:site-specific DNA-methyltransferase (adenine-specific)
MADDKSEQGQLFDLSNNAHPAIKGFPDLRWTGKHPFKSTEYFPAQLKERYGNPSSTGWMNQLYWGDNLQVMSHLLRDFAGKIDTVYIDPPFDSKADYKKTIQLRGTSVQNDQSPFEEKQYGDIWTNDEYLQFMYERLIMLRELLSDTGSIFLHCDWHRSHQLRCLLDEVFGPENFKNEILWCYSIGGKGDRFFGRKHDTIFWYSKTDNYYFDGKSPLVITERKENTHMRMKVDENGRQYQEKQDKKTGKIYRYYVDEGKIPEDYWTDIQQLNREDAERVGYPTQKPEALLQRIIASSTPENGIVFDCFMGSGTTPVTALKLGRRFIGADINLGAIQATTMRLLKELDHIDLANPVEKPGFEVSNVNNYDFFRNPQEAKQIIVKLLELQPFASGSLFDGEKDGRLYKIMPTNRIATKSDVAGLIAGLPYSEYDKKMAANPNEPVDRITLVCMGHEPDLLGSFKQETQKYNIDVEIHDVLLDDKDIQLKRDSEARIELKDGKLVIESFYPMNLLQKLNMVPESVHDWKQLVDSVFIDWNYDGKVFQPTLPDVPEDQKLLVRGEYTIPANAKNIRVKITDLLSESIEVDVK